MENDEVDSPLVEQPSKHFLAMSQQLKLLRSKARELMAGEDVDEGLMRDLIGQLHALESAFKAGLELGAGQNHKSAEDPNPLVLYAGHPADPAMCFENCEAYYSACQDRVKALEDRGEKMRAWDLGLICSSSYWGCWWRCKSPETGSSGGHKDPYAVALGIDP